MTRGGVRSRRSGEGLLGRDRTLEQRRRLCSPVVGVGRALLAKLAKAETEVIDSGRGIVRPHRTGVVLQHLAIQWAGFVEPLKVQKPVRDIENPGRSSRSS